MIWAARSGGAGCLRCDLRGDPEGLAALARDTQVLLSLAGITPAAVARGADYGDEVPLALAALHAADAAGAHTILCSSAAVYGRAGGVLREEAGLCPVAPYGVAKAAMETAVLARAAQTGQGVTLLRIGNVAGADAALGGWRAGFTLDVFPDGTTPARSYIGPVSLARVLGRLLGRLLGQLPDMPLPQVLNIAAPGVVEMGALLDAAGRVWTPRPAPETAIARVELATARLEALVALERASPETLVAEWRADGAAG